ncbi:MAG: hypothetical protein V4603_14985, partial [Pseudomonadota bacterium]
LSEYDGELYYLGIQTDISADFHPPYLGHKVIVEGRVSEQPRICGGIVLEPVKISVVAELDKNCDTILPVDERYQVDFSPRPPGPSGGQLAFQNAPPAARAVQAPAEPGDAREFTINYAFDGKVEGPNAGDLGAILRHAESSGATRIKVMGHAGGVLLSNGTLLQEKAGLAQARAEEAAMLLKAGGLARLSFEVAWEPPSEANGMDDWQTRRTDVVVLP